MKIARRLLFSGAALLLLTSTKAAAFSKLYVFGDSLSDTGNAFSVTGSPPPPYANGRFSNGLIWVDDLGQQLGLTPTPYGTIGGSGAAAPQGINFAFGGATTGTRNTASGDLPGLQQQIDAFIRLAGQAADPQALYIVWAGANDYLGGHETDTRVPLANLTKAIDTLKNLGARNILVANLPNLGLLPATRNTANAVTLERLTAQHNASLADLVNDLRRQSVNIKILDVNALFGQAVDEQKGFTNTTQACFDRSAGTICPNPDSYLFWDGIHPTAAAHLRLEETAIALLQPAPISHAVRPAVGLGVLALGLFVGMGSIARQRLLKAG